MSSPDDEKPGTASEPSSPGASEELDERSEQTLRNLVRGAVAGSEPEAPDVLSGVQRRIRQRSRGKFYADGWSTARHPPIGTYLLTSVAMLILLLIAYSLFGSLSGEPAPVENQPAPVHIVIPRPAPS
jgi:hypothetical protein